MSKRFHLLWIVLLLSLLRQSSQAQDSPAWATLDKILHNYIGNIAFKGHMQLSLANDPSRVIEEMVASYLLAGHNMDCKLGYMEVIGTPDYFMTVDNRSRFIFITSANQTGEGAGLMDFTAFKKALQAEDVIIQLDSAGEKPHLAIDFKDDPQLKSCVLYYDPTSYVLDHASFECWDDAEPDNTDKIKLLKISYSAYRKPSAEEVNAIGRKVLTVDGGEVIPQASYQNYRIVSQL